MKPSVFESEEEKRAKICQAMKDYEASRQELNDVLLVSTHAPDGVRVTFENATGDDPGTIPRRYGPALGVLAIGFVSGLGFWSLPLAWLAHFVNDIIWYGILESHRKATIPDHLFKKVANSTDIPANIKTSLAGKLKEQGHILWFEILYEERRTSDRVNGKRDHMTELKQVPVLTEGARDLLKWRRQERRLLTYRCTRTRQKAARR